MGAAHMADGVDHHHDHQAERDRDADVAERVRLRIDHDRARAGEDERERADRLGDECPPEELLINSALPSAGLRASTTRSNASESRAK